MVVAGAAFAVLLAAVVVRECASTVHKVDWTTDGVKNYTDADHPLLVSLGDVVMVVCSTDIISNFIYVEDLDQYEKCDSAATDGKIVSGGDCIVALSKVTNFSQSIQQLSSGLGEDATIEYKPGEKFYFLSFSNGTSQSLSAEPSKSSGGQCSEGLKMVISVAPAPVATTGTSVPTNSPDKPEGKMGQNSDSPISQTIIIVIVVVGVVVVFGGMGGLVLCVLIKWKYCSRTSKDLNGDVVNDGNGEVVTVVTEAGTRSDKLKNLEDGKVTIDIASVSYATNGTAETHDGSGREKGRGEGKGTKKSELGKKKTAASGTAAAVGSRAGGNSAKKKDSKRKPPQLNRAAPRNGSVSQPPSATSQTQTRLSSVSHGPGKPPAGRQDSDVAARRNAPPPPHSTTSSSKAQQRGNQVAPTSSTSPIRSPSRTAPPPPRAEKDTSASKSTATSRTKTNAPLSELNEFNVY